MACSHLKGQRPEWDTFENKKDKDPPLIVKAACLFTLERTKEWDTFENMNDKDPPFS